jgi:hypothetical protein
MASSQQKRTIPVPSRLVKPASSVIRTSTNRNGSISQETNINNSLMANNQRMGNQNLNDSHLKEINNTISEQNSTIQESSHSMGSLSMSRSSSVSSRSGVLTNKSAATTSAKSSFMSSSSKRDNSLNTTAKDISSNSTDLVKNIEVIYLIKIYSRESELIFSAPYRTATDRLSF